MGIKFLAITALFVSANAIETCAQNFNTTAENQSLSKPIELLEGENKAAIADLEKYDPTISYYVQSLNLTPKQLLLAQKISAEGQEKKEELLRRIDALRREAYNLEASSLIAFEAILDDDQKAVFNEMRTENPESGIKTPEDELEKLLNE